MNNRQMANKGRGLEALVEFQNEIYRQRRIADIRKVHVNWVPIRGAGGQITGAYPAKKSELDFKGTLAGGQTISFDCKETANRRGLPCGNLSEHQVEYIQESLCFGEFTFILCEIKPLRQQFVIPSGVVVERWHSWQANRGVNGYGVIPVAEMILVPDTARGACDYLKIVEELQC